MEDETNVVKSESTEEIEDKSETDLDNSDKFETEKIITELKEEDNLTCSNCNVTFSCSDELKDHNIRNHPIFVYRCTIKDCSRWFISRKSRDKHSENLKSWLHRTINIKPPPSNGIFIEEATPEQIETCQLKRRRGPKPKGLSLLSDNDSLMGLPKDQLKRKLMESVIEELDYLPSKKRDKPKDETNNNNNDKANDNVKNKKDDIDESTCTSLMSVKEEKEPPLDLSYINVPIIQEFDDKIKNFQNKLILILENNDPGNYFKYPFIDQFAPNSSKIANQVFFSKVKENVAKNNYETSLNLLNEDLLAIYMKGLKCYPRNSPQWKSAAKLYQTVVVNMENARKRFPDSIGCNSSGNNNNNNNDNAVSDAESNCLPFLNPYNNGMVNEIEKIETIGQQVGKLYSGSHFLNEVKENRHNKAVAWSYLDYGANFSFGPTYDSGNSQVTEEMNRLLYDNYNTEKVELKKLEYIIPEPSLGDDFSLYLMNTLTYDTMHLENSKKSTDEDLDEGHPKNNYIQSLLNTNWNDIATLRNIHYKRLGDQIISPTNDEIQCSNKLMTNLSDLISRTPPSSVVNNESIRKLLKI